MSQTFTGASFFTGAAPALGSDNDATIMFWMYTTSLGNVGIYAYILGGGTNAMGVYNYNVDGNLYFSISNGSTLEDFIGVTCPTNTWTHVAFTKTSTTLTGYINGASIGSFTRTFTFPTWTGLQVGGFAGTQQDVRFFLTALNANQILAAYQDRSSIPGVAPFASYPLFAGTTPRTIDFSGNGRTLTATGTPTDGTLNAPAMWSRAGGQLFRPAATVTSISGSGSSQSTGAATLGITYAITASGLTQSTGASGITVPISASGSSQSTGAANVGVTYSVTASGASQSTGAATVGITYPIAGTGNSQSTGAADVGITYPIAASGLTSSAGAATESATFVQAATGSTQSTGAATVSSGSSGNLTASGSSQSTGAADIAATFVQTGFGMSASTGSATVTLITATNITASGNTSSSGAAATLITLPIAASGNSQSTGASSLDITIPITATGSTQSTGSSSLDSGANIPASGNSQSTGAATVTALFQLTAAGMTSGYGFAVATGGTPAAPTSGQRNAAGIRVAYGRRARPR